MTERAKKCDKAIEILRQQDKIKRVGFDSKGSWVGNSTDEI